MTHAKLSRREFVQAAGITLGAVALVSTGAGCTAQSTPAPTLEVETPSYVYGDESVMNARILVAYATRTGSTVDVAAAIGETLAQRGFTVDVKPIQEDPSPDGYQAIVLGSAINGGQWLPEALEYVKNHQQALNQAAVALFCVHIMNLGDDDGSTKRRLAYLDVIRSLVTPVDEGFFAGMGMDPDAQAGIVRWIYRTFKIGPEGDCRDWDQIRGWAQTVSV